MEDDGGDDVLLQRVRDAILAAGGVPKVSAVTGIPKKTLEKYLAKRSMASLANAAKIAAAANLPLGQIVGEPAAARGLSEDGSPFQGFPSMQPADVAKFTMAVLKEVRAVVGLTYKEEGVTLAAEAISDESERRTQELLGKLDQVGNLEEARSLLPWVGERIRQELRQSRAAGLGTGKREAS